VCGHALTPEGRVCEVPRGPALWWRGCRPSPAWSPCPAASGDSRRLSVGTHRPRGVGSVRFREDLPCGGEGADLLLRGGPALGRRGLKDVECGHTLTPGVGGGADVPAACASGVVCDDRWWTWWCAWNALQWWWHWLISDCCKVGVVRVHTRCCGPNEGAVEC
jgi:hypothetical protein